MEPSNKREIEQIMDEVNRFRKYKETVIILFLSLTSIFIHLYFYDTLEFHRDELLYLSLGGHPDFGFYSVPPMIGLLAFIAIKLFGYTLFAARIFPAIAGGVLIYLSASITKELKGSFYAQVLTAISLAGSILFLRAFGLFQPVPVDILFWTLSIYFFIKYINTNIGRYLIYFGISAGLGILNKYNIIFLVLPVCVVIPFTKYRRVFLTREFYYGLIIAFLIALPNIIWQIVNHLPVINHMAELRSSQLVNMSLTTFLTEQLLMVIPATLMALPGLFYLLASKHLKGFRILGMIVIIVFALYMIFQGKSYYSAGVYPLLIAAGAVFYEKIIKNYILRMAIVALILGLIYIFIPMGLPVCPPGKMVAYFDKVARITGSDAIRRDEDNQYHKLPQDYSDMLGWNELTALTNIAWQKVENKNACLIYAENYGEAGAISIIGKKFNLPEPVCFNESFLYWAPKTFNTEITEAIYINGELGEDIRLLFDDIQEIGRISNPLAREYGVQVYWCKKPNRSFNRFWEERIKDM